MMLPSFQYPMVLFLLVIPVFLIAWTILRNDRQVKIPVDHSSVSHGWLIRILITSMESVVPITFAIVIIILAGPLQPDEPKETRSLTNIQFCVDVSGSMTSSMGEGSRYDASMAAIIDFVDQRKGDAFGLTFFGNEVLDWVPLTKDTSAIKCSLPFMDPKSPNHPGWLGGTEIGKDLKACRKRLLNQDDGDRMVVLVSDGYSGDLGGERNDEIIRMMEEDNITIYAIHVAQGEAPPDVVNIAIGTGGDVFVAGEPGSLEGIFKQIDKMQPAKVEKTSVENLFLYWHFCLAAFSAACVSMLGSFGLRYTPW